MNTNIWLVRHGETEWNIAGRFQGCKDIPLTEVGLNQAKALKCRFNNSFDAIYTSPLTRAIQTAKIISENSTIKPIIENEIREINFGEWEGLTINEIAKNYPEQFKVWKTDQEEGSLIGGDLSIKCASIRARNAILKIANNNANKNIIIVAHGGIIKAGLIGLFDWDMTMYHKILLGNTSISKIILDSTLNTRLVTLNDTNHLK
jgi:probable phosphoglycerate mutase